MKSMKKITSLVGSTALLGGAVVAVPLVSTACGTLNEFSATAEAIQDGPRQSDDRNSTSAVEVTLDGATAEDVLDAT
ncbi:hypothetical protein FACS1894218_5540 [Bacilli bacterium]|nr:hypothetical protein FACS1894218_5540 [Bacilli bacterium]